MLSHQHAQPAAIRTCFMPPTAIGAAGFTFQFPMTATPGGASAWFDHENQCGRVLSLTAGITFSTVLNARSFRYAFVDGNTGLTTFVVRSGNMTPPSIGSYLEQSYGLALTNVVTPSTVAMGFYTWPKTGIFIRHGDLLQVPNYMIGLNPLDTVQLTATVELFN